MDDVTASVGRVREQFLAVVADVRPELHRYCARLTGSVVEGEDIVQETLARAFYTLSLRTEAPPIRPWLFKIAHNAALDHLKRHGHRLTDLKADLDEIAGVDDAPDPSVVRAALSRFVTLPLAQRSAVILKDVLDCSLEEAAETMGTTVPAVKAALVRGRARLREPAPEEAQDRALPRADLERYASLFNAKDWDGLRGLIGDDCRLDLVSKAERRGKEVGMYFGRYAREDVTVHLVTLEGRPALAAHVGGAPRPAYFILLEWEGGKVAFIRDYRYVPYVAAEAALAP